MRILHGSRRLIAGLTISMAVAASIAAPGTALAGFTTCLTDPTVHLSNGVVITLDATVATSSSDVRDVAFTLHVPKDVQLSDVQYDQFRSLESISILPDHASNIYRLVTVVWTGTSSVPVTISGTVSGATCNQPLEQKDGISGRAVTLYFHC